MSTECTFVCSSSLSFFNSFPELIRQGHLFVLQTPLFRVRNKKTTLYCYDDTEREAAIKTLGRNPEITRFKGLGEISPDEFKHFIGDDIRLDPVKIDANESLKEMLKFFMGKNTPIRQEYIIRNLRFEHDILEEEEKMRRMEKRSFPRRVKRLRLPKRKWPKVRLPESFCK